MYKNRNVKPLTDLHDRAANQGLPLSTIIAEVLQLVALDALFSLPESQHLCFQGGTCIHLLHGGYRYSEDLDFAGSFIDRDVSHTIIAKSRSSIEKGTAQILGPGESEWRVPRVKPHRRIFAYWYHFRPQGARIKYRLKIEFGRYPVYEPKVYPVMSSLDFLQKRTLVMGATPEELLIEKVIAVIGRPYLKGRDLFDIWYLDRVLKVSRDIALTEKKLRDYGERPDRKALEERLRSASPSLLANEMKRFLPQPYRSRVEASGYKEILESAMEAVECAINSQRDER
jgi:predicted nucleotidyltransferase component of viral defense system